MQITINCKIGGKYDTIVCGGGPAGLAAAVSSARKGAKTLLIEQGGCLGGFWTRGLLTWLIDTFDKGELLDEVMERLIKNADGKNIGELLINNRGGLEGVDAYVDTLLEEYEGQSQVEESLTCGSFDCRRIMVAINGINVCHYYGYYQIPDETVTYRNVRFELEINEYYYKETGFPTADLEAIMNSIVIK